MRRHLRQGLLLASVLQDASHHFACEGAIVGAGDYTRIWIAHTPSVTLQLELLTSRARRRQIVIEMIIN